VNHKGGDVARNLIGVAADETVESGAGLVKNPNRNPINQDAIPI
jgi:hypothetical protein